MTIALVAASAPRVARAEPVDSEEIASAARSPLWLTMRDMPDVLHTHLAVAPRTANANANAARMQEIRLSNGAKVAIIITAIVVGGLIILAVVASRGPDPHPF
jgi:hypothetical protein